MMVKKSVSDRVMRDLKTVDSRALHDGLVRGNLGLDLGFGLIFELEIGALLLVVDGRLDLALSLQSGDDVLVFPSDLVGETAQHAELAVGLETEDTESGRNDVSLSLVVRSRDSFVGAVALHGVLAACELVGQHAADGLVEDAARGSVMERPSLGVDQATLAEVVHVLQLVAVEASGNVDTFASDHDDSLALKEGLGDDGGKTTQQMASPVDHQRLRRKTHCSHNWQNKVFNKLFNPIFLIPKQF